MALQSAKLLVSQLAQQRASAINEARAKRLQYCYARAWHRHFAPRLRLAALYAHLAMRPKFSAPLSEMLRRWPELLTQAARIAGKARKSTSPVVT